jgi:hypothetical protein
MMLRTVHEKHESYEKFSPGFVADGITLYIPFEVVEINLFQITSGHRQADRQTFQVLKTWKV